MSTSFTIKRKLKEDVVETVTIQDELKCMRLCTTSSCEQQGKEFWCFWCRLDYNTQPIYAPLRYRPKQVAKAFIGKVSSETYVIKGNVQTSCSTTNFEVSEETFEVDGIFCSYECTLAFILENKKNTEYLHSETLLYKMFRKNNPNSQLFSAAPHWRLLKRFGGHLSKEDFHKNSGKFKYSGKIIFVHRVFMIQ
jgi:hypothetical protein